MRKRWRIIIAALNIMIIFLMGAAWQLNAKVAPDQIDIYVRYGEEHANQDGGTSQLFWSDGEEGFSEDRSMMCNINEGGMYVMFSLPELDLETTRFRLDPFMNMQDFSILSVSVVHDGEELLTLPEGEFVNYVESVENCRYTPTSEGDQIYTVLSEDAKLFLSAAFNERILEEYRSVRVPLGQKIIVWSAILFFWLEAGVFLFVYNRRRESAEVTKKHFFVMVAAGVLLMTGGMLIYGVEYLIKHFKNVRVEELIFQMKMPLEGTNTSSFDELFRAFALIACISILAVAGLDILFRKLRCTRGVGAWLSALGVVASVYALVLVGSHFDIVSYWNFIHEKTTLYEENYADGREVAITFPKERRNLIYIYLESMETTYAAKDVGGAMEENYMPELTELAMENIDFSADGELNGAHVLNGATFTTGAIVAHTAGIPVNTSLMSSEALNAWTYGEEGILPGAWTIGDALKTEGYNQMFLIGSNGDFGGRTAYMHEHGGYEVKDYYTAIEEGKIDEDYYVWWGYEDEKLIGFAKENLMQLAAEEEPFNFSMLTVDTHFTDGYVCARCEDKYGEQYSNVIACSSSMIAEFIAWIQQQEFYEDTTIVIAGDHLTMDSHYITQKDVGAYDRKTYFTIINPAEGCKELETEREYSTFDIYPTTMAALGVEIEGNRLGLGVNLFSEEKTLYERYDEEYLNEELLKASDYYSSELME